MGKIEKSEENKRLEIVRFNNENLYCNKDDVDFLLGLLEEERRKNKVHIEHIEYLDKKVANQRQRLRTGINYKRLNVEELCKTFDLVKKSDVELQDRILRLIISDMQSEGYFKDMKYESVVEYYKRRKDLWEE